MGWYSDDRSLRPCLRSCAGNIRSRHAAPRGAQIFNCDGVITSKACAPDSRPLELRHISRGGSASLVSGASNAPDAAQNSEETGCVESSNGFDIRIVNATLNTIKGEGYTKTVVTGSVLNRSREDFNRIVRISTRMSGEAKPSAVALTDRLLANRPYRFSLDVKQSNGKEPHVGTLLLGLNYEPAKRCEEIRLDLAQARVTSGAVSTGISSFRDGSGLRFERSLVTSLGRMENAIRRLEMKWRGKSARDYTDLERERDMAIVQLDAICSKGRLIVSGAVNSRCSDLSQRIKKIGR